MANNIVKFFSISSTTYNANLDKLDQNALYFVSDEGDNSFSIHKGRKALCATQVFNVDASAGYVLADLLPTIENIESAKLGDYLIVNVGSVQHLYAKMTNSWFDLTGSFKTEITEISTKLDDVEADVSALTSDVSTLTSNLSSLTSDVASVETRVDTLESKVETIASATRFAGVYDPENLPDPNDFVDPSKGNNGREGDIIVSGSKEYILVVDTPASGTEGEDDYVPPTYRWEELGDVTAETSAITQLQSDVEDLQASSHTHDNKAILDTIDAERVAAWDAKLNVSALCWNGEAEIVAG